MSPRRPRREEIAAAILAPLLVGLAIVAWVRRDATAGDCCGSTAPNLEAPIPPDAETRSGRLSNHLRYFVRPNGYPEHRAELRLVVDAGSALEAPDQLGLAHAVEHMVFRGTKHFPGHAVDDYLESIGMRQGSDINASTSNDETIYHITIPTNRAGALDTALAILAGMAHEATFDLNEARQEAGVVMSEWRSRSDAGQRLSDERDAVIFAGSAYAGRTPIGDTAVLRRFDVGAMRRFYTDWYRPDLMSVVAVGDFDAVIAERLIKKHFGGIPASESPRHRPEFTVSRATAPRAAVLRDPEATGSRISFWYPRPPIVQRRLADVRALLVDELLEGMLGDRIDAAAETPGSPILGGDASTTSLARPLDADIISVRAMEKRSGDALDVLSAEVARFARYGVPAPELRRRADALLRDRRNAEEWMDSSDDLADALVDAALTGRAVMTRESSYEIAHDLLPTIGVDDIRARAGRLAIDSGTVLFVTQPTHGAEPASAEALIARARTAADRASPAARDTASRVALVTTLPQPGSITAEKILSDARVFDWTLGNGMRVILKPTRFTSDEIEFRLFGSGGASLAADADYASAYLADAVLSSTGVGPLNGRLLERRLDATSVSFSANVHDENIQFTASSAPRDLDLVFQLFYLYFTSPRADTIAFRRHQERVASYTNGRTANPDAIFADSVRAIVGQHHPRALKSGAQFMSAVSLPKSLAFWKQRTANASSFTLVVTGDFSPDRMRPLVTRYLASLPAGTAEHARDVGLRFPSGITRRQIVAGLGPKARTEIVLSGPFDGTSDASEGLGAVRDLTELVLTSYLRERLGGTYSADVSTNLILAPPARYSVTIDFEAAPERIDSLATAALDEIDRLRAHGPTEAQAEKIRATRTRDLDGKLESNGFWASELARHARMGWPLGTIARHQDDAKLLSRSTLAAACEVYLRTTDYVHVTMYPAKRQTP